MAVYALVVQSLAAGTLVAAAAAMALLAAVAAPAGRDRLRAALRGQERHPIAWAWGVAAVATGGSLYLSDGVGLVPCLLCWYQRIAMYPLVLVLAVGWLRGEVGVWRYALPLALVGLAIAGYHRLLQARPTLDLVQCGVGPPCSGRYLNVFGFVTIPTMAAAAFALVAALLLVVRLLGGPATADGVEPGARP